jgi:cyclopropane-fatty-acyl-phospholipid synthase
LKLSPADHLLEIGTGWGGFAIYATREYGCRVTTTTISQEQYELAQRRVADAGLENRITILASDYRDLQGSFDKLVSIEMIEAVGHRYLSTYFEHCCRLLKPAGLFVLQAITIPDQRYEAYRRGVDFIQRYIFPGGCLPSLGAIHHAIARSSDFQLVHQEDFAAHYARTLSHWHDEFRLHEADIRELGMDNRFLRAWEYYFSYCQAAFAERQVGVSQLVFARSKARTDLLWEVPPVGPCHE